MSLNRFFLFVAGLGLVGFGAAYLIAPVPMAAAADLAVATPLAAIEIRGFYGGQLVGLGVFVLLGAWRPAFVVPALLLLATSLGGTALGRVAGILAAGSLPSILIGVLAIEVAGAVAALLLWQRERTLA